MHELLLTLIMLYILSSAKVSSASHFQSAPIYFKFGENAVLVSNSLDPDETPSDSASHLDPSCLHMSTNSG